MDKYTNPIDKMTHTNTGDKTMILKHKATQGKKWEILLVKEDDGSLTIEQRKHGKTQGRSTGYNLDLGYSRFARVCNESRAWDGINYNVNMLDTID